MICKSCGNEMNNEATFCPHCGAPAGGIVPAYSGPEAPVSGGGKKKTGLLIGGAVALVAVIALAAAAVGGLFSNPKVQVEQALAKSAAAYMAAEERLGLPDVSQWQQNRAVSQSLALELTGINSALIGYDLSALEGLGLRMDADYDINARKLSFDMGAYWGEEDLLSFQLAADDDEMYFRLPQFTGDTYYGVNTETLGADLTAMTGDDSMDSVSFNLFDLMELALDKVDPEALEQSLQDANKALWAAAEVKKEGGKTLDLNGSETKTTLYHVTIPQQALEQYVDDVAGMMSAMNYFDLYEELFRSMGMPERELEDLLDSLEELDIYSDLADSVKDALDDFGDLELDICLSGGYVSALLYEDVIDGADVELALYLGGGGEYVDDLSMELKVNSAEITLESTGDHGLKGGVYTDETTIRVRQLSTNIAKITSELSYNPRSSGDNLQWELGVESSGLSLFTLEAQGGLTASKDAIALELDDISLRMMGMEVCSLLLECSIHSDPHPADVDNARLISDMGMLELMNFAISLQANAVTWAEEMEELFTTRLPAELLYGLTYMA